MATPISQAYKELSKHQTIKDLFKGKFYREEIPKEILQNKNTIVNSMPFARINDITNERIGYASNRANYTQSTLQLSVWGDKYSTLDQIDEALNEFMAAMGYAETFSYTTRDPDIDKPYLVKRYSYYKEL